MHLFESQHLLEVFFLIFSTSKIDRFEIYKGNYDYVPRWKWRQTPVSKLVNICQSRPQLTNAQSPMAAQNHNLQLSKRDAVTWDE